MDANLAVLFIYCGIWGEFDCHKKFGWGGYNDVSGTGKVNRNRCFVCEKGIEKIYMIGIPTKNLYEIV